MKGIEGELLEPGEINDLERNIEGSGDGVAKKHVTHLGWASLARLQKSRGALARERDGRGRERALGLQSWASAALRTEDSSCRDLGSAR